MNKVFVLLFLFKKNIIIIIIIIIIITRVFLFLSPALILTT